MKPCISLLLTIVTFASAAVAQSTKDKIEIGVQTTSLTLSHPDIASDQTEAGIGGRFTFNFNRYVAAEAEINFFPQRAAILIAEGSPIQGQFGVKIGKRFEKFGIFGKFRPGFLSVNDVGSIVPPGSQGGATPNFTIERHTFFTMDVGGVLELYPSRRMIVRLEAGDTLVRHPARFGIVSFLDPNVVLIRPAKFNHNFQFTAGVGFRLGDFPDEDASPRASGAVQERTKRFEVGAQFTSLFVEPLTLQGSRTLPLQRTEPGFGARFTFNLTENIAFEAEGNYFTRLLFAFPAGGHIFQGQFGGKVGKRFDKWGLFGKVRPGFVGFTRAVEFSPQPPFQLSVKKHYPSLDIGGVLEFYVSPRWMARFDVGDTVIRYGEIGIRFFTPPFVFQEKQTRHNLQVSSGIGFRF
jgi:hypothetical protein